MRRRLVLVIAATALSCASNNGAAPDGSGTTGTATTGTIPCTVDAVLDGHCRQCHQSPPLYGAPMPMMTWGDLHAGLRSDRSVPVYQRIHARIHDDAAPMPPPPNARLSAAEAAVLDGWIAAGAPSDGSSCAPATGPGTGPTTSPDGGTRPPPGDHDGGGPPQTDCVPDMHIAPASPYTMTTSETYACYGFDVPNTEKRHVTEIRVHVDNPQIVHHVLLLKSPVSSSGTPIDCSPAPSFGAPMLYAWAPGGLPLVVPSEAGFPQDGTTHYMVQIHYNNAANAPLPKDATGFDMCTTSTLRKYDADVVAFGSEAIVLPPRASTTVTSCFTVSSSLDGRKVFAAFPHMHKLGSSIATSLRPGGSSSSPVDLGTDSAWSFNSQPWLPVDATLHSGDVIRTQCIWNNATDGTVTFGPGTGDEMCYSFTAYYPISNPALGWAAPATASGACQ